ncbi:hypothetical protein BHE74_00004521 [Ensete ventricosum]|nr:hypothetical protein GW17_00018799 [Ensete ventricosum]RWW86690.1 hypothetical protein BHE74_00004521 [Ensete ventricosum]
MPVCWIFHVNHELIFREPQGKGIERNFIYEAASKHAERCFLSTVTISRCKSQKCAFDSQTMEAFGSVHKETIVIEWDGKEARTTVVKERLAGYL